jgi:hypothetical protein
VADTMIKAPFSMAADGIKANGLMEDLKPKKRRISNEVRLLRVAL